MLVSRHLSRSTRQEDRRAACGFAGRSWDRRTTSISCSGCWSRPKPVRVYSQGAYGYMEPINGSHDVMFTTVTMDNGVAVMIGGGWNLPPSYPNYCATWIEITGTDGSLFLDDTQRDNWLNTEKARPGVSDVHHAGRVGRSTSSPAAWARKPSISSRPASATRR